MLPPNVRRLGSLGQFKDDASTLIGKVATFHYPDGVQVTLYCRIGEAQGIIEPDYRGRWGTAPILYGWRVNHPDAALRDAIIIHADSPALERPFRFVCVEEDGLNKYGVYWWRALESAPEKEIPKQVADYFFSEA